MKQHACAVSEGVVWGRFDTVRRVRKRCYIRCSSVYCLLGVCGRLTQAAAEDEEPAYRGDRSNTVVYAAVDVARICSRLCPSEILCSTHVFYTCDKCVFVWLE